MIIATEEKFQQPWIQSVSKGDKVSYRLVADYCFEWSENGNRYRRTVFAIDPLTGTVWISDLASTPDEAAPLGFRHGGTSDGGSILHDRGYQIWGHLKKDSFPAGEFQILKNGQWVDCDEKWTRLRCDELYKKMCLLGLMTPWRADVEYDALRDAALGDGLKWFFS